MFLKFDADFLPERAHGTPRMNAHAISGWDDFMARNAGATCLRGLYRIHNERSGQRADALVREAFPSVTFSTCFAFDWMGRQIAFNPLAVRANGPDLYLFDHVEGEAYEMPFNFHNFHNEVLFREREIILMINDFAHWLQRRESDSLGFTDCITHTTPLILGGRDEPDNLEVADIDVTWSLLSQIREQTADLPNGASISGITAS